MCLSTSFMVLSHSTTMGLTATLLSRSWAVNNAMPYTLFPSMNNWSTATPSNEKAFERHLELVFPDGPKGESELRFHVVAESRMG